MTDMNGPEQDRADEVELSLDSSGAEQRYAPSSSGIPQGNVHVEVDPLLATELSRIPDKMAFKIGEVAELLDVKPYVLRYWETEFEALKPKKSKHNQRMYERRDVENLFLIKKLLYRDRFSIEGARAALKKLKKDNQRVKQIKTISEHIEEAKDRVLDLLDELDSLRQLVR
jgi:DNA-binding transcriptional MerR regulator